MPWFENMPAKRLVLVDDLEVWVIKKKRNRHMYLRVQPDGRIECSVPYAFPDDRIEGFVRERRDWIEGARQRCAESPMGRAATASEEELREWRKVVEAFTPALVEKWEPVLGVKAGRLVYRKMKSRWGSCQPETGRICINIVLALYPLECLEYVVVHELCHLRVPGHGAEFQALMDEVLPNWRILRKKLQE